MRKSQYVWNKRSYFTSSGVNMSKSCRHVEISPCLWLFTKVPVGIWIRDKFKLNRDRSVKTPWQEYPGIVAGSWWWAPGNRQALIDRAHKSTSLQAVRFCIRNKISPILYLHNTIRPSKKKNVSRPDFYKKGSGQAVFFCYLLFPIACVLYTLLPSPRDTLQL